MRSLGILASCHRAPDCGRPARLRQLLTGAADPCVSRREEADRRETAGRRAARVSAQRRPMADRRASSALRRASSVRRLASAVSGASDSSSPASALPRRLLDGIVSASASAVDRVCGPRRQLRRPARRVGSSASPRPRAGSPRAPSSAASDSALGLAPSSVEASESYAGRSRCLGRPASAASVDDSSDSEPGGCSGFDRRCLASATSVLGGDGIGGRGRRPRPRPLGDSAASAAASLGDVTCRRRRLRLGHGRVGAARRRGPPASCSATCWRTCANAAASVLSMPPSGSWTACDAS